MISITGGVQSYMDGTGVLQDLGDLDADDVVGRVRHQRVTHLLGELSGVAAGPLRRRHGHVGGELAVLAPGRSLEVDLGRGVDADRAEVLSRARAAGVQRMVVIGAVAGVTSAACADETPNSSFAR